MTSAFDMPPLLFALRASHLFGERVAKHLGLGLAAHEERDFEDGEHKTRPRVSVRDRDVYVVQSLYSDASQSVNDKLCRLLFFIGALRDASAGRVTAVVPYLAYARKDRKTQSRDPVTTRYVAALFEAAGADRVITIDVHNLAAYQNAFRCRTEHLDARGLFSDYLSQSLPGSDPVAVVSPDIGGIKRAERFRTTLTGVLRREPALGFLDKARARGVLTLGRLSVEVAGQHVLIIDDLISTGGTLAHAAQECRNAGARTVHALATHGLFVGGAKAVVESAAIDRIIVTDTVAPFRFAPGVAGTKVVVLTATGLFGDAIGRLHGGGSLVELLGD